MAMTLAEKASPQQAAVIVVDVQNDYCHPDGMRGRQRSTAACVEMAPRLERFLATARAAGVRVVWVRTENDETTVSTALREQRSNRPDGAQFPCYPGSWGADYYHVRPLPGEPVVTKHRYSGFIRTDLDLILRCLGVRTLLMTGVSTNACVESTARDGFMLDYHVVLVEDCCAAGSQEDHESTVRNVQKLLGVVATSEEIARTWTPAAVVSPG